MEGGDGRSEISREGWVEGGRDERGGEMAREIQKGGKGRWEGSEEMREGREMEM